MAWMLLSNASVLSLEDGVLTLRFARDGDMKGFSVSGHDAVLKRVLSGGFGLNVTVRGVAGDAARPACGRAGLARARVAAARPVPPARVPARPPGDSGAGAAPPDFAGQHGESPEESRRTTCRPMSWPRTSRPRGRPGRRRPN